MRHSPALTCNAIVVSLSCFRAAIALYTLANIYRPFDDGVDEIHDEMLLDLLTLSKNEMFV